MMRFGSNSSRSRPILGLITIALGLVVILSPFLVGEWTLALLGLALLVVGTVEIGEAVFFTSSRSGWAVYAGGGLLVLAGLLLFLRPLFVLSGLLVLLAGLFVINGLAKIVAALRGAAGLSVAWTLFNGVVSIALGAFIWKQRASVGIVALGLFIGIRVLAAGWSMLLTPVAPQAAPGGADAGRYAAERLGLPQSPELDRLYRKVAEAEEVRRPIDRYWCLTLVIIFFAIHIGRMESSWTILGLLSPAVAVAGDVLGALLAGALLILPARLLARKLTRPLERSAWRRALATGARESNLDLGDRLTRRWLQARVRLSVRLQQARAGLGASVARAIQMGLPVAAVLVAINPIWGFSWYFNTENWASEVWNRIVEQRVDPWRVRMIEAVLAQAGSLDPAQSSLFEVKPPGVAGAEDFSFIVIGDPGEGDPSQHILRDRYLEVGRRPDIKFLVISSDVIYPSGDMKDYERKFYLPFKGFDKPVYAIPGNHDWFSALDGFAANFLEPDAARVAIHARVAADHRLTSTTEGRIETMISQARRLQWLYGVRTGWQHGTFFEIQGERFSLIAVDTGILKHVDPSQQAWLEAALDRARGKFVMAVLGHPFYAGGVYQGDVDPTFSELHRLLRDRGVAVVMAGDTHDFEYYHEQWGSPSDSRSMHHFVNGGGGAYLSIGTALAWPSPPPVPDYAFYPSTAAVAAKLEAETPPWKRPVWWWVRYFNAWPVSVETLSGVFDFNQAPFFQSFMEVRVEGSANCVRLILHGPHGPLRWGDLGRGGRVPADPGTVDAPVEFVVPLGLTK